MNASLETPSVAGQLVWCPADPALGVGVVTDIDGPRIKVRFLKIDQERAYTTRDGGALRRYQIERGERVWDQAGAECRVTEPHVEDDEPLLSYSLEDGREVVESDLVPDIRDVGAKERLATLNLAHPEIVRARVMGMELARWGKRRGHAAVLGSRVQWLPHQVDVATQALEKDSVRRLLADEVGLGKTVEAALIYAALRQEQRAERVLILVPDALCIQWLGEIYRKAHELPVLFDGDRLDDALHDMPESNPFEAYPRMVTSIDWVTSDELIAGEAADSDWDLVIVDEAHHLRWNPKEGGNEAYRLIEQLSKRTKHMLLLTATPMALDPAEYHALLRLLDPSRFDAPENFDSIRSRVTAIRELARSVQNSFEESAPLPAADLELARSIFADDPEDEALLQEVARDGLNGRSTQLLLDALRERHGLADVVVRNRRGPVGGLPTRHAHIVQVDLTPAQELLNEVGEGLILDIARTLSDPQRQSQTLASSLRALWATPRALETLLAPFGEELVDELRGPINDVADVTLDGEGLPTGDARLRWLVQLIRSLDGEKLLVFVESPVSVEALRISLETALAEKVAMFHRGLSPRDQDRQVAWFRSDDGPRVMLSTEAGGEGRNFQFCHHLVLYDLPWRPATVEQRIGRIDRVGQANDVEIYIPYFAGGYEAAVVKVMNEAVGVFDQTVGGIDHSLEYVSARLASLILEEGDAEDWKALFIDTAKQVKEARERIEAGVDPIIDHASFSPERADEVLSRVPKNLESQMEWFVQQYADANKLEVHNRRDGIVAIEGAPSSSKPGDDDSYYATFSREYALDHEDVDFLSFGHPLVQGGLEWAQESEDASAALALARGFKSDGAVFVWRFRFELPDESADASAFFDRPVFTIALDESGERQPDFDDILERMDIALDRMDHKPLLANAQRWNQMVQANFMKAQSLVERRLQQEIDKAHERMELAFGQRERQLKRIVRRGELAPDDAAFQVEAADASERLTSLQEYKKSVAHSLDSAAPRNVAAVAVRLVKSKSVSA